MAFYGINYFLLLFSDYFENSWNRLEYIYVTKIVMDILIYYAILMNPSKLLI